MAWTIPAALVVGAALALSAAPARAETAVGEGVGTYACSEFARVQLHEKSLATLYFSWAQGWMTGWNLAEMDAAKPSRDLKARSANDEQEFLRTYCAAHPKALYMEAVYKLFFSLPVVAK
ncbi:MAG: hypothetical protein ACREOE_08630 [Gemmatimonadales bacterium]